MKTYCVGDIHGAYSAFKQCLEISPFNNNEDRLICLGDVVDGYPQTYEVIEELLSIKNLVLIRGNHDKWFTNWIEEEFPEYLWLEQGGKSTLQSYLDHRHEIDSDYTAIDYLGKEIRIPNSHIELMCSAKDYFVEDNIIFVHGGFDRSRPVDRQNPANLHWDRELVYKMMSSPQCKISYDRVFLGHTTTLLWGNSHPIIKGKMVNLDTGAGYVGKVTIMDVNTLEYYQSEYVQNLYPGHLAR